MTPIRAGTSTLPVVPSRIKSEVASVQGLIKFGICHRVGNLAVSLLSTARVCTANTGVFHNPFALRDLPHESICRAIEELPDLAGAAAAAARTVDRHVDHIRSKCG